MHRNTKESILFYGSVASETIMFPLSEDLARKGIFGSLSRFAGRKQALHFSTIYKGTPNTFFPSMLLPPPLPPSSQHLQGYMLMNRSKTAYLMRNKTESCVITTTRSLIALYQSKPFMANDSAGTKAHLNQTSMLSV